MTGEQVTLTEAELSMIRMGVDRDEVCACHESNDTSHLTGVVERILAARVPEAKAEAWDEGYERAALDRYESLFDPGGKSPNPYRAEAPQ